MLYYFFSLFFTIKVEQYVEDNKHSNSNKKLLLNYVYFVSCGIDIHRYKGKKWFNCIVSSLYYLELYAMKLETCFFKIHVFGCFCRIYMHTYFNLKYVLHKYSFDRYSIYFQQNMHIEIIVYDCYTIRIKCCITKCFSVQILLVFSRIHRTNSKFNIKAIQFNALWFSTLSDIALYTLRCEAQRYSTSVWCSPGGRNSHN